MGPGANHAFCHQPGADHAFCHADAVTSYDNWPKKNVDGDGRYVLSFWGTDDFNTYGGYSALLSLAANTP
jgi:hypothetical protein